MHEMFGKLKVEYNVINYDNTCNNRFKASTGRSRSNVFLGLDIAS